MWQGAYTALVTPFNRDGAVDYGKLRALVEEQVAAGITGLVPVGTTGESPTVDYDEHHQIIEVCIATARRRCKIVAGTGANSTREALELTQRAKDAALELGVQLFNLVRLQKRRCGREIEVGTVVELAKHPQIVALKEAGGNADRVSQIAQRCALEILSGDDALTLPMMVVGAVGVISVASNVAPKPVADMVRAALQGDWPAAQALHKKYYRLFTDLFLDTNPVPVKAAMAMQGKLEEIYRLPLCEMAAAPRAKLAETLTALGLI